MYYHEELDRKELLRLIQLKKIVLGGNRQLRIYGTLHCRSGRRMKKANRVFFLSAREAIENGYRPCGHCLKAEYSKWKQGIPLLPD